MFRLDPIVLLEDGRLLAVSPYVVVPAEGESYHQLAEEEAEGLVAGP